eukprot:365910-Chlamydomonas_euryale.AAC.25
MAWGGGDACSQTADVTRLELMHSGQHTACGQAVRDSTPNALRIALQELYHSRCLPIFTGACMQFKRQETCSASDTACRPDNMAMRRQGPCRRAARWPAGKASQEAMKQH